MTVRWIRVGGLAVVVAVALAACNQAQVPSPGTQTAVASPAPDASNAAPSAASPPAAPPSIDPALAQGVTLTCGDGEAFPAETIVGAGGAEGELEAASLALRQILSSPDGSELGLPQAGWHRAVRTATRALFVAPATAAGAGPWVMVSLNGGPTGWSFDAGGECHLAVALPDGIGSASWWLDPAAGPPPVDATFVAAFVRERECASGKTPDGRVLAPAIFYGETSISVMFAIRKRPGPQDCPANPPLAITLNLTEATGGRTLLDGGEFPPRDAAVVPG